MMPTKYRIPFFPGRFVLATLVVVLATAWSADAKAGEPAADLSKQFDNSIRPVLAKYCVGCHSTKKMEGELDLQRFTTPAVIRKETKPWQLLIEQLESGEMPPKGKPQPSAAERKRLVDWTRHFLQAEARSRAGDPGRVPLHRLSNAEYNNTVRDLTGVDLQPAREFPADGAAGEGFTNAAEALTMSPAMMAKYLDASKKIASHVVLLPEGFRFSPRNTRRDWTDESLTKLRAFYHQYTTDGRIPLKRYLSALIHHRSELQAKKITFHAIAKTEKLSAKYLQILWEALNGRDESFPLKQIRARWNFATDKDVDGLAAAINAWRDPLWSFVPIGSYRYDATVRAVPKNPSVAAVQSFRLQAKPEPGQNNVTMYLVANDITGNGRGHAVWQRPRFEAAGKPPLLLRDFATFAPQYETDYAAIFGQTTAYLSAVREAALDRKASVSELARKRGLDAKWLQRWIDVLALDPNSKTREPGRAVPKVALTLLNEKAMRIGGRPAINGWKSKGAELPIVNSNSSDRTELIPGRASPHKVTVHPTPTQFVAVVWTSPITGNFRIAATIAHAHNACGNGVAWWIEKQTRSRSAVLAEGNVDRGKTGTATPVEITVQQGDRVFLAIDARDRSHVCDLTEVTFSMTELAKSGRQWDLAADVADSILAGNPHTDRRGNKAVWSFAQGTSSARSQKPDSGIPAGSLLARWRIAAVDPARKVEADKLAMQVQSLLTGKRPERKDHPDRKLFDNIVTLTGILLQGFSPRQLVTKDTRSEVPAWFQTLKFDSEDRKKNDFIVPLGMVIQLQLPAALLQEYAFVLDGTTSPDTKDQVVQFQVATSQPLATGLGWNATAPLVAVPNGIGHQRLSKGFTTFRRLFPPYICYPHVIPLDEVVCLKTFHREDEPLIRLFLDDSQAKQIDKLWAEHRFITKYPVTENEYLPLFIGFVTQDQPKKLLDYFNSKRGWFRDRAARFQSDFDAAATKQLPQLVEFASRAFRRPVTQTEKDKLQSLYDTLRSKKMSHEEAFRNVVARVLISPSFLLHLENPPPGDKPQPVNDWELASRLSYFLWGTMPDEELRQAAAAGKLHNPRELEKQTRRMLQDSRVRGLAIEFGTQWIHVRNFDSFNEKNEKLFPTFGPEMRRALYEESILFFQDLFQQNRPVTDVLNSDSTYLNEQLAKHYGIPGITGPEFRRVTGVRKYGRGGILGLASVQAKQAGSSRTSPVLRGNWVVETLLGERLPRPPANVPRLPEAETGNDGLTMRQLVENHTKIASCAACHVRIDPFGFAFESYDPIGRRREKDLGGLPVDTDVTLRDGTKFQGLDGLRTYLLTKKKDVITRLFCRRLLGYALGRSVTLSDDPLLDEIMADMKKTDGRTVDIILKIVKSPQFQRIRGNEFSPERK